MKKNRFIFATFLSILIYLIYLKLMNIYPFGEYSILKSDLYQQYVNFLCYLREIILNGKSMFISWNLGLGNNFFTTFAYYLMSPLNIGVIFFKPINMDIFVEILTFIKITLAVNFAIIYFEKVYKFKSLEVVLFGLIYGYSSYVICYSFHIMWLDSIYMLPLVLLFVDRFIENGKILPYTIALIYTILTNYYMGYIVAFFSGIYFLAKYFINSDTANKQKHFMIFIKSLLKFLLGIAISFGIGMIVILPSIRQLGNKMSASTNFIEIDVDKIRLFVNVLFNNYVYMFTQKSCLMFSSTLVLVLLPMYYLNKKISWKEKLSFTAIVLFLLLPIISPFLNRVWHAFTIPNCFNYRYSFVLIFTLIIMAFREYQNRDGTSFKSFIFSFCVFSLLTILEIVSLSKGYLESDGYTVTLGSIALSSLIYIIMLILVFIINDSSKAKNIALIRNIFNCNCRLIDRCKKSDRIIMINT